MKKTTDPKKYLLKDGWRVKIGGRCYRLGWDATKAEEKRRRLVGAWLSAGATAPPARLDPPSTRLSVAAALAAYLDRGVRENLDHAQRERIARACAAVVDRYGQCPVFQFGGPELKTVRTRLLGQRRRNCTDNNSTKNDSPVNCTDNNSTNSPLAQKPTGKHDETGGLLFGHVSESRPPTLSRVYVNSLIGTIKTAWSWLVSERLAPADRLLEIRAVRSLEEGDGGRETTPVLPPDPAAVDAALPYLCRPVAAMVRLQRLTGMRPGEVCRMRRAEISTSPAEVLRPVGALPTSAVSVAGVVVWVYAPTQHKTRRKGKPRLVALGPEAQAVLRPFMECPPMGFLFRPSEGERLQRPRGKPPGEHYTTASYGNAVRRACRRAGVEPWHINQLRHAAASRIAADFGWDSARAVLGHGSVEMTKNYIAVDLKRAAEQAAKAG